MLRNIAACLLMLTMALATTACGSLPQPFAHGGNTTNPLLELQTGFGVRVEPPSGMESNLARAVATGVAERLEKAGVPATAEPGFAGNLTLVGKARIATILDRPGAIGRIDWRLSNSEGREVTSYLQWVEGEAGGWSAGDPKLAPIIADAAASPVIEALTADPEGQKVATSAIRNTGYPRIAVIDVINAPGDGRISLPTALRQALARHGVPIAAALVDAAYIVGGEIVLGPPKDGQQRIVITWKLRSRDGTEVGKISQNNQIPAGSLNGRWGPVADIVATAASPGIAQAVAEVEAVRAKDRR